MNINNYNKTLEEFKEGFKNFSKNDLEIKGFLDDLNPDFKNSEIFEKEVQIKAKNGENIDIENIKIEIPLINDILYRNINEKDLELYY